MEAEDAVGMGFGGVEVVLRAFEGSEVFDWEIFWELFDREAGKIVGHSIESWGSGSSIAGGVRFCGVMVREMRHGLVTVMKGAVGQFTIPVMY